MAGTVLEQEHNKKKRMRWRGRGMSILKMTCVRSRERALIKRCRSLWGGGGYIGGGRDMKSID